MVESMTLLEENDKPIVAAMPVYDDIYTGEQKFQELPPRPRDLSATRIVAHSSGASNNDFGRVAIKFLIYSKDLLPSQSLFTGMTEHAAKLQWHLVRELLSIVFAPEVYKRLISGFGARNYTGKVFAVHCLAMYHAIGINFMNWMVGFS